MNRDSNGYTFLFTVIMVLLVAITLATAASLFERFTSGKCKKRKNAKYFIFNWDKN